MEKKNKNIITVSFDKDDPQHQEVIEILNALGRKKAKYIVRAVLFYKSSDFSNQKGGVDYQSIKDYVLSLMKQYGSLQNSSKQSNIYSSDDKNSNINDNAKLKIKDTINSFRHI